MDHKIIVCEPVSLTPPSSSLCSQLTQLHPNTPEKFTRRYHPNIHEIMQNEPCFNCGKTGHWFRDCPSKSSNIRPFNNNNSQCTDKIWCRCGHGFCEVKTAKSERNRGKMYYTCPIKRGEKCKDFVKWCDDPNVESDFQPPTFKYPECKCPAGVCKRVEGAGSHGVVKYYFTCPIKKGQGFCGYLVCEDELLDNRSIERQICERTLNGFEEGDQNEQIDNDMDEGGDLLVKHSKKMRIMQSSGDPTLMGTSFAEPAETVDAALENHNSFGDLAFEDGLLDDQRIPPQSCKRTLNGYGESDQNNQTDSDLGEGGDLLAKHSKKMRVMDSSEDSTLMVVSEAELALREDASLMKASQLSCLSLSTPSRISGRQNVFQRHIYTGADTSIGSCSMDWLGCILFSNPPQSLKISSPQQIFCRVFPSFNPVDVPKQASIPDVPFGDHSWLDVTSLSQQTQLSIDFHSEFSRDVLSLNKSPSSSERKLMSRAQRQRQVALIAQKQLLIDLVTLEPHQHESMKKAADDTFALLDNLGANDTQFFEHIWNFISLNSSIALMNETIETSLSPEEHRNRLEEEEAKYAHIHNLYVKTEAQFQASDQRRQSLCKEISHFEAMLFEKKNQLKSCELETSNIEMELGDLRRTMLEADTALKARAEQAKAARERREETQEKQIAVKTALQKAVLELEYQLLNS